MSSRRKRRQGFANHEKLDTVEHNMFDLGLNSVDGAGGPRKNKFRLYRDMA